MITTTDIANMQIAENGTPSTAAIIKELIGEHDIRSMQEGADYFKNENDILDRVIYYWKDGEKVEDETSPNNRVPHNFHKVLVRQKMGYLVGKPIAFSDKEASGDNQGGKISPNKEFVTEINNILDEDWDDTANELVKGSANKGVEWLQPYIEEIKKGIGEFKYAVIDAREVISIWETSKLQRLDTILRYYTVWVNGKERYRVEWWTKDTVTYYIQNENGEFILDDTGNEVTESEEKIIINPSSHYYYNGAGYGWGVVPFIPFKNNEELSSDLQDYKKLIDIYDQVFADGANNIEQIQDVIWILKNYAGQGLEEFQDNLRKYKAMKVDGDGGADTETIEIPTEAREKFLDRTEENIYTFGMGVDVSTDKFGQNPTGVALKFLYALLDLKCDTLERKFKKAIRELLWFIAEYYRITQRKDYNYKAINITFNRSMIINETEKIESVQKSKGIVDDETALANHPWVDDPQKVLNKLKQQKEDYINLEGITNNNPLGEE